MQHLSISSVEGPSPSILPRLSKPEPLAVLGSFLSHVRFLYQPRRNPRLCIERKPVCAHHGCLDHGASSTGPHLTLQSLGKPDRSWPGLLTQRTIAGKRMRPQRCPQIGYMKGASPHKPRAWGHTIEPPLPRQLGGLLAPACAPSVATRPRDCALRAAALRAATLTPACAATRPPDCAAAAATPTTDCAQ